MFPKNLSETEGMLNKYYSDSASSYGIVQQWFIKFCCGHTSTETIPSPGRPNEITTPEMLNKIHDIVLNDSKVKVHEIAEIVFILTERVVNILHTYLCMRKLSARWVPWLLTIDHERNRMTTSGKNLAYFNRNPKEFSRQFVSMDETCIHHYSPESCEGVFWDAHGVIFIDSLEKGTADYWSILCYIIGSIGWSNQEGATTFEEEKNPSSWWQCTISYIEYCTGQKAWIAGGFDKSYYVGGIKILKDRWTRCFELEGEYIEK